MYFVHTDGIIRPATTVFLPLIPPRASRAILEVTRDPMSTSNRVIDLYSYLFLLKQVKEPTEREIEDLSFFRLQSNANRPRGTTRQGRFDEANFSTRSLFTFLS